MSRPDHRCLILVAHGSRRAAANDEVRQLAERLGERLRRRYAHTLWAFLELAEPSIPAAIDRAVAQGAGEIVVLPYFLATGRHVAEDIPELVAAKRAEHPAVTIRTTPYLGVAEGVLDLLAELARK